MISYQRNEIISSSKTAKNLGQILNSLKTGKLKRAVISKNNELEAVILPIDEYEKILETVELIEHIQIAKLVKERENEISKISFDEVLESSGINRNEI
jgi:PHD/YefM family antitoxin component YafN of YafNO toxin-antitoxin module